MSDPQSSSALETVETVEARITRCVAQVLCKAPGEVGPQSRLIEDLGADSLDLVELMYVLEDEFSMNIRA